MKSFATTIMLLLLPATLYAQDNRLPKQAAQRYAKLCVDHIGTPFVGQVTTDVDVTKPCAERGEGGGAMVVPVKSLSKKLLAKTAKDVVPVGQLWLRKWVPVVKGKAVPHDQLRIVTVPIDDKDRPMPLLLLGVRRNKAKALELVVYAKGEQPLQVLPLKQVEFIQELPMEMEWQRGEKQLDTLTVTILGAYQAVVQVTRQN